MPISLIPEAQQNMLEPDHNFRNRLVEHSILNTTKTPILNSRKLENFQVEHPSIHQNIKNP